MQTRPLDSAVNLKMVTVPAIRGQMASQFRDLVATVEKITGYGIDIKESATYQDAIEALKSGHAHIAWLGAKAYLEGAQDADIEAFAVAVRGKEERSTYRTFFVTRFDSKIESLTDVRGKRLVLSEKGSTSGDLMPRHELAKFGLNPEAETNFKKVSYSGGHEASIASILAETNDVAAVSEINYERLKTRGLLNGNDLKIIHASAEIPGAPLVYSRKLPAEIRNNIKQAVINAHKHGAVSGYGERITKYESQEEARWDFFSSYLKPQWGWRTFTVLVSFILLSAFITLHLEIKPLEAISNAWKYIFDLLQRLLPPDFTNFRQLLVAMFETVEIGIIGTILATLLSIPVGLLAARNIAPNKAIYYVARTITIFFRAIPEFIMAMILVIAVGFGALPGVLALGFHTMGFLAKFFAEEMEDVSAGPIEALRASGASRFHIVMFAIVPQVIPSFVGFILYILDRNIRMATMLGIVGAGGIGYLLQSAFRMFHYREVSAIIIIIFATIYLIDILSSRLRLAVK